MLPGIAPQLTLKQKRGIAKPGRLTFLSRRCLAVGDVRPGRGGRQRVAAKVCLLRMGAAASDTAHRPAIMMEEAGWVEDLLHEKDLDPVKDAPVVEDIRKALKGIAIQGRRCKEITQKLLSFARRTDSPCASNSATRSSPRRRCCSR